MVSVIALSDINNEVVESYSYDVFVEPNRISSINNPYMFTGRRLDAETDLYYYRARVYSPEIGRFLQPDPIGYDDGLNIYAYVGNNPANFFDPSGLCKDKSFGKKIWDGDYVGTGYGNSALDRYVNEIVWGNGKWYNYVGGFFSALWTPKTWKTTAITLGTAGTESIIARAATKGVAPAAKGLGYVDDIAKNVKFGKFKSATKWANQMSKRGWNEKQIAQAIKSGKQFNAINKVNPGNSAIRYVHPKTGNSVVVDTVTNEILHIGGKGFVY